MILGYLEIDDLEQLVDVDKNTRCRVGEDEITAERIRQRVTKVISEPRIKVLKQLRMPHLSTLKQLMALLRINRQTEINSIKRMHKRYNTCKWQNMTPYIYFMKKKLNISYYIWTKQAQTNQ